MSEYIRIHREGQRVKWQTPKDSVKKDSVAGNHVDVRVAFVAERPNLSGEAMSLMKSLILLPQVAHLMFMPRTLFSFRRKAESTPEPHHVPSEALLTNRGAPLLFGGAMTVLLNR